MGTSVSAPPYYIMVYSCSFSIHSLKNLPSTIAESLYLVFTSVHEVMVSAVRADVSVEEMQRRLHNGSRTVKEPEEKLTEQVYCYDGKSNCIRLAKGEGNVFQCDE